MMKGDKPIRVGLIFGGRSGEHDVSLQSARSILAAMDRDRYSITEIGIAQDGAWLVGDGALETLSRRSLEGLERAAMFADPSMPGLYRLARPAAELCFEHLTDLDVVFPVLHGTYGEDGTLQGLLEMAGVAYVGAGVLGSSLGMDKGVFKEIMRALEIPVLPFEIVLRSALDGQVDSLLARIESLSPYPLFTKPANLGSSVGISKCKNRSDLLEGLLEAAQYDRRVLVEKGIEAREIEVSVLGNDEPEASIPGEIIPAAEFYTYAAKYHDNRSRLLIPAPLDPATVERVQDMAIRAYRAIDCAGLARVDFLLETGSGEVFLNELNTMPGFTKISMYPKLWEASGLPYPQLIDRLISLGLERRAENDRTIFRYDGKV